MEKILVISVHPDDETLGMGGTILKLKDEGKKVFWLNVTSGNEYQKGYIPIVEKEYSFDATYNLEFPEIVLSDEHIPIIIGKVGKIIKDIKCDTIFLPNRSDIHTDHQITFKAIISTTKSFRYPFIKNILMYETLSETEFAPALHENVFIPNTFVDISKYIQKKISIMNIFESEILDKNDPRSLDVIKAFGKYRGSRIGVEYAEAFYNLYMVL